MDEITALHTAARRFCQEEFAQWTARYTSLQQTGKEQVPRAGGHGWDYSHDAYEVFPRYRLMEAIQDEVEKMVPVQTGTLEDMRALLLGAAQVSQEKLARELTHPMAHQSLTKEANDYQIFVRALNAGDLMTIEPLPYRRVLNGRESGVIWERLKNAWNIGGGYWFPLRDGDPPANVIPFHEEYFEKMGGREILREALATRGVRRVFQLHEFKKIGAFDVPEYEIELPILQPTYSRGGEQYSTSEETDWVVYASHESSITIAGDWLTDAFKRRWTDWSHRTYQGPYSTADLRGTWDSKLASL